jgi:hypothetical protein
MVGRVVPILYIQMAGTHPLKKLAALLQCLRSHGLPPPAERCDTRIELR